MRRLLIAVPSLLRRGEDDRGAHIFWVNHAAWVDVMQLRDIRYFLVLCEELHFTRAADRCGVSQSCISAAIRKIEAELGGALFHRKPQPRLSELGQAMRPLWDEALRNVERSVDLAQSHSRALAAPPASPVSLADVRQAMERIVAEPADVRAGPLPPGEQDDGGDAAVMARLRDQRIVVTCRARRSWRANRTRPMRKLAFAAVTVMIVVAAALLLGRLAFARASEHGGQATAAAPWLMSSSGP
jgi:DNA-binding transcriptional LysR family regulator